MRKQNGLSLTPEFIIGIISIFIIYIFFVNINSRGTGGCRTEEKIEKSLLQSLQSSTAIYVAQQRVPPEVFSDFLVTSGEATEAATITLANAQDRIKKIENIDSTEMVINFTKGIKATYYLDGTDVTATYEEMQDALTEHSEGIKHSENAENNKKKKKACTGKKT